MKRPEVDESKLPNDQRCVLAINDLFLAAARIGDRATSDANFKASLDVLEEYVKSELRTRSVARAVADNDLDHMREAADILRTMTATADANSPHYKSQPDTARLSAWYTRDMQKGTKL